jgi:hypothetical protein
MARLQYIAVHTLEQPGSTMHATKSRASKQYIAVHSAECKGGTLRWIVLSELVLSTKAVHHGK